MDSYQPPVVRNTVERAKLVRAHLVTCSKVSAEMLEALPASGAQEALVFEPGIDFCNRTKLTRIN
jgi:hypothetical protein